MPRTCRKKNQGVIFFQTKSRIFTILWNLMFKIKIACTFAFRQKQQQPKKKEKYKCNDFVWEILHCNQTKTIIMTMMMMIWCHGVWLIFVWCCFTVATNVFSLLINHQKRNENLNNRIFFLFLLLSNLIHTHTHRQ